MVQAAKRSRSLRRMKLGYVMTVFPHQGHLWFWRERCWMKQWQVPMHLFATRQPEPRDRAKHAWAESAVAETTYLWPMGVFKICAVLLANFVRSPVGFVRSCWMALRLDVDFSQKPRWKHTLPLIVPACHLASLMRREGITH